MRSWSCEGELGDCLGMGCRTFSKFIPVGCNIRIQTFVSLQGLLLFIPLFLCALILVFLNALDVQARLLLISFLRKLQQVCELLFPLSASTLHLFSIVLLFFFFYVLLLVS
jgi:hypothetical protein